METLLFLTKTLTFCRRLGVGLVANHSGSHLFILLLEATSFNFTWKKTDQSTSKLIKSSQLAWSKHLRLGNDCKTYQDLSLAGNPFQVGNYFLHDKVPWERKITKLSFDWRNQIRGRCRKNKSKKELTSVSFPFTHTYTLEKLTLLLFFPQASMENFEKCAKEKNITLSHVICGS